MMRTTLTELIAKFAAVTVFTIAVTIMVGCPPASPPLDPLTLLPTDAQATCTVDSATFNSWFQSGSVTLNGVVNPANSVTFPNNPNCSFYQWAKQDFLWLTSPAPATYGGGGGLIVDSPAFYDVSPPDASGNRTLLPHAVGFIRSFALRAAQAGPKGLQLTFDAAGRPIQVKPAERGAPLVVLNAAGQRVEVAHARLDENRKPILLDKNGQVIRPQLFRPPVQKEKAQSPQAITVAERFNIDGVFIFIDPSLAVIDVEQGEAQTNAVLEAQMPAGGSLIYYASIVNDVYAYYATGVVDGVISLASDGICTPTSGSACFPTTQAQLNQITPFAAAHGTTFPDANALAIEVKSAWVVAAGLPNLSSYITMDATIPVYNPPAPPPPRTTSMTATGQQTVKLALVGMHVVGSAAGHPEMIWATFEHVANTPAADYSYINTGGSTPTVKQNVSMVPTIGGSSVPWVFCAATASAPFNNQNMVFNGPPTNTITANNPPSPTIAPSNTIRWKAFGGGSDVSPNPLDSSTAASNTEVISINNSVGGMLASGDIRKNYIMTGATWTIGGAAPFGIFPAGNEVGTSMLANTTMETYNQGKDNTQAGGGFNCFSCHFNNTTQVSHIFTNQRTGSFGLKPLF